MKEAIIHIESKKVLNPKVIRQLIESLKDGRYLVLPVSVDACFVSYRLHYPERKSRIINDSFPAKPKTPAAFHYLLQHGFDLFGLIDAGLAISKSKN